MPTTPKRPVLPTVEGIPSVVSVFSEEEYRKSIYIISVYSPFSDRVGLPLHNTPFPGVLMKSIGTAFFDRMPFLTSTTCVGCNIK